MPVVFITFIISWWNPIGAVHFFSRNIQIAIQCYIPSSQCGDASSCSHCDQLPITVPSMSLIFLLYRYFPCIVSWAKAQTSIVGETCTEAWVTNWLAITRLFRHVNHASNGSVGCSCNTQVSAYTYQHIMSTAKQWMYSAMQIMQCRVVWQAYSCSKESGTHYAIDTVMSTARWTLGIVSMPLLNVLQVTTMTTYLAPYTQSSNSPMARELRRQNNITLWEVWMQVTWRHLLYYLAGWKY